MIAGVVTTGVLGAAYLTGRILSGECPDVETKKDFNLNINSYTGRWYEMQRSSNIPFERGTCITADYSVLSSGYIQVLNSQYLDDQARIDSITGKAQCSQWNNGHCQVRFSMFQPWGDY